MTGRMKKILWAGLRLFAALARPAEARAQAYDGDDDWKLCFGYINFGGNSGLEFTNDYGLSDYFSVGTFAKLLLTGKDRGGDRADLTERLDVGLLFHLHLIDLMGLPPYLDIYAGPQLGFFNGGLSAGVRYNFSESWGVYAQVHQNLFKVFDWGDDPSLFKSKFGFSVGITFNLK